MEFVNIPEDFKKGTEIILKKYKIKEKIKLEVFDSSEIKTVLKENNAQIYYDSKACFFRQLGILLQHAGGEIYHEEKHGFETSGVMLDLSRGGILTVAAIKEYIEYMAVMGLDTLWMYMEDVYEIKNEPYFGYMRGRYTADELRECDEYARLFGIEIVPCIQTLGHMEQFLKWSCTFGITDTGNTLLCGSDATYKLIENMISSLSECFSSRRIHIGMDEAPDSGLGRYLELNGYHDRMEIYLKHINRVTAIAEKYGLRPMIWSDMLFKYSSKEHQYYDTETEISAADADKLPKGLQLVYWDYYHINEGSYYKLAQKHVGLGRDIIYAGSVWSTAGLVPDYLYAVMAAKPAVRAAKRAGIKECITTMWADDGCETSVFLTLSEALLYAELTYNDDVSEDEMKSRYEFVTGRSYDLMLAASDLLYKTKDAVTAAEDGKKLQHRLKMLIYSDILTGLFDFDLEKDPMSDYYKEVVQKLKQFEPECGSEYLISLGETAQIKSYIAEKLYKAYRDKDIEFLRCCADELLDKLAEKEMRLCRAHRELWFRYCKGFGWEVMSLRYGGMIQRAADAKIRISDYLSGKIERIEELEETRLPNVLKEKYRYKYIAKTVVQ